MSQRAILTRICYLINTNLNQQTIFTHICYLVNANSSQKPSSCLYVTQSTQIQTKGFKKSRTLDQKISSKFLVNRIVEKSPLCSSLLLSIYHIFLNHKNDQEWPFLVCFPPHMAFSTWSLNKLYNSNKIPFKKRVMFTPILVKTDWSYLVYNRRNVRSNFRIFPPSVKHITRGNKMFWGLVHVCIVCYQFIQFLYNLFYSRNTLFSSCSPPHQPKLEFSTCG